MRLDILSENLKWLRKEKGLKLENLEHDTGISKTTLSALENLDSNPVDTSFRNIVILADYYGVSIDYLLGREHDKEIAKTEIDELGLSDKAIKKLKTDNHHSQMLSLLITTDSFDEFLNRLELLIDRSMESVYGSLNQYYQTLLANIKKNTGKEIPQDEVMNILTHCNFDDSFERYNLKEFLDVLVDELLQKYGNKVMEDKSVNSPLNQMLRSAVGAESGTKPTMKDMLSQLLDAMPEEEKQKATAMLDGIDTAVRTKNFNLKRMK